MQSVNRETSIVYFLKAEFFVLKFCSGNNETVRKWKIWVSLHSTFSIIILKTRYSIIMLLISMEITAIYAHPFPLIYDTSRVLWTNVLFLIIGMSYQHLYSAWFNNLSIEFFP